MTKTIVFDGFLTLLFFVWGSASVKQEIDQEMLSQARPGLSEVHRHWVVGLHGKVFVHDKGGTGGKTADGTRAR